MIYTLLKRAENRVMIRGCNFRETKCGLVDGTNTKRNRNSLEGSQGLVEKGCRLHY